VERKGENLNSHPGLTSVGIYILKGYHKKGGEERTFSQGYQKKERSADSIKFKEGGHKIHKGRKRERSRIGVRKGEGNQKKENRRNRNCNSTRLGNQEGKL